MGETANEAGRVRVKREGPIYRIVHQGTVNLAGLKPGERPVVLSLGGGLGSWWTGLMLFLSPDPYLRELRRRLALIIHADLGAEWPETYDHLHNVQIPFFRQFGYDVTIIYAGNTARDGRVYEDITSYYMAQEAIPTKAKRSCTPRWKIGPCMRASADLLGTTEFDTLINFLHMPLRRIRERYRARKEAEANGMVLGRRGQLRIAGTLG